MNILLSYVTSPNNKVYAILYDQNSGASDDNHKKAWLVESPDNENLGQWNKLIELTQSLDGFEYFDTAVISMEIHSEVTSTSGTPSYTDTIYIFTRVVNSPDKLLVITIDNTSNDLVIYDIPNDGFDYEIRLDQQQAFYIDPQGKLYLGIGTILWTSNDKGKTWEIFYDFKEYPCIIKANQNLMAVITSIDTNPSYPEGKKLYLAPIGSNNFQYQGDALQEHTNVYSVFFHTINTPSKMLIVLDRLAPIKSFEYSITGTKITLKPIDEKNAPEFHVPDDFLEEMSDMTQLGGNATIGVVNPDYDDNKTVYYYNTIQVSSKGKFGEAKEKSVIPVSKRDPQSFQSQKLTLDVNNKNYLLYLGPDAYLYISKDLGTTWKQVPLTINF